MNTGKSDRHKKIIELIEEQSIGTQEELARALNLAGLHVTQATVSRDIRELKLTKTSVDGKGQRYVIFQSDDGGMDEKYARVLREGFISMEIAGNILVIKTVAGMAMAVCAAVDAFEFEEEVGSIAGDDTIMIACKSGGEALILSQKISEAATL